VTETDEKYESAKEEVSDSDTSIEDIIVKKEPRILSTEAEFDLIIEKSKAKVGQDKQRSMSDVGLVVTRNSSKNASKSLTTSSSARRSLRSGSK
jgi:F0F1-type ATP synthase membrane subunit b/b'